jgi:hypothetical protein
VVLKPSDTTPATTVCAEIAAEFLPPGVFNVICGDRDTGRLMVDHEIPAMVSITGSVRAGMEVAGAAAPRASSGCTSSSAARRRSWSSTTPTSRRPPRHRRGRVLQRRAGLHRRHQGAGRPGSTTTSSPR